MYWVGTPGSLIAAGRREDREDRDGHAASDASGRSCIVQK